MINRNDRYNRELIDAIIRGDKKRPQEQPKRRLDYEESHMQQACVRWARLQYPVLGKMLFSVPNGGARGKREAGILKAEGVVAGVSDLILLMPRGNFGALCIEMKQKGNYQQKNQKEWQEVCERVGNKYVVCKTIEEFMTAVNDYMRLPRNEKTTTI